MPIADDISVAVNGDIRYTGASVNYTVIELHRFLQDLADNASSSGDDLLDITYDTPSDRSTDNIITLIFPYNIDDVLSQHLYDGSIIQTNGDEIYDGVINFGVAGIYIDVIQNGALVTNFWTTGLNADANAGISHRFLIKTRTGAADIDGRRVLGITREFGNTYSEFPINGTSRGNNVLALTNSIDLNNQTAEGTVSTWGTITNIEGYRAIDVDNDTFNEYYYSEWNKDTYSINQFYERMKWLTRRGTVSTIYGISGDLFRGITHEIEVDTPTGTFDPVEPVSWATGTGQLLAIDSVIAGTKMWIQLLTGTAPVDAQTITGDTSGGTVDVNLTVTARSVSSPFVGASTGSALIGAYGLGVEATDLSASDKVFDLDNTQVTPPNNVIFTVSGLIATEDRVLVGPESGGVIDTTQMALSVTLSGASETEAVMNAAIPPDTPSSGTIRVETDLGLWRRVAYSSFSGSTFTFTSNEDFSVDNATSTNNAYISYIDVLASAVDETFSVVYNADRGLFIRVRDGGITPIKTFETTGSIGSAGGSATVIRTSDE